MHPLESEARALLAGQKADTVRLIADGQDQILVFPKGLSQGTLVAFKLNLQKEGHNVDYHFYHGPSIIVRPAIAAVQEVA